MPPLRALFGQLEIKNKKKCLQSVSCGKREEQHFGWENSEADGFCMRTMMDFSVSLIKANPS